MISLIAYTIGGVLNAMQDTLADHWDNSIFNYWGWSKSFWHKGSSWERKYWLPDWIPDAFTDGWHIVKFVKLVLYGVAIVCYDTLYDFQIIDVMITDFLIIGMARNLSMSLFYHKIFYKEQESV